MKLFFRYFIFCVCLPLLADGKLKAQKKILDSLWNAYNNPSLPDTSRLWALDALAYSYSAINPDSGLIFSDLLLYDAKKKKFPKIEAYAYNEKGINQFNSGRYDESLKNYNLALEIFKKIKNKKGESRTYNNIGLVYMNLGNYPEALQMYFSSLKIKEETGDKKGMAFSYNNIGNTYKYLGDTIEALKYLFHALAIRKEIGVRKDIADSYNNLGNTYYDMRNTKKAMEYQISALKIRQELGDKRAIPVSKNNIGNIFCMDGNDQMALKYYKESLEIFRNSNDIANCAYSYNNIGNVYLRLKQISPARKMQEQALLYSKQISSKSFIQNAFLGLSSCDSFAGNFKSALENYKLYILYRDSLQNEENTKKLVQSQMQYDFDKKSAADSIKNSEAKKFEEIKHQQEISKQRTFTYGGIAGFLVMIIVAGISFRAFRNKKKANVEIQHQKELVEEKQKEILDSIYYARRIQRSLLTSEKYIERNLKILRRNK